MKTNIQNYDKYIVAFMPNSPDIELYNIEEFYTALDNGLYKHDGYIAYGYKDIEEARNAVAILYDELSLGD